MMQELARYSLNLATSTEDFNSLQTGKHRQRREWWKWIYTRDLSFNSLQTGKHRQRGTIEDANGNTQTFQFPSNGKVDTKIKFRQPLTLNKVRFNSLQTGRWIQSCSEFNGIRRSVRVSIPFKREGGYKVMHPRPNPAFGIVSIPFKREGGYKGLRVWSYGENGNGFNSLQTGRWIQSSMELRKPQLFS